MAVGLTVDLLFLLFITQAWAPCGAHGGTVAGAVVGGAACLSPSPEHQRSYSQIHVVPKPKVMVMVTKGGQQRNKATLKGSVGLEEVTYEWIPPRQILLGGVGGPVRNVSFNPSEGTCIRRVGNAASSNSSRHPCSWTAESLTAAPCTAAGGLLVLGHLLLLFCHLALA